MPFAAVWNVNFEGHDLAAIEKRLREESIPRLRALPGFQAVRLLCSLDGTTGVGTVIFDTEANATAHMQTMATQRPADLPPVTTSGIYEVVVEI